MWIVVPILIFTWFLKKNTIKFDTFRESSFDTIIRLIIPTLFIPTLLYLNKIIDECNNNDNEYCIYIDDYDMSMWKINVMIVSLFTIIALIMKIINIYKPQKCKN
jgi:hypothetical protein